MPKGPLPQQAVTLATAVVEEGPRMAVEQFNERVERGDFQSLDGVTAQEFVGRGDRQLSPNAKLVRVLQAEAVHVFGDGVEVPKEHELEGNVKFPLAQSFILPYTPCTHLQDATMTATATKRRKVRLTDYEKKLVARLRQHVARAIEVTQRNPSRSVQTEGLTGDSDCYAFDLGALEAAVKFIASATDELFAEMGVAP